MPERKQRINVTLSPETLKALEEKVPEKQRSPYIEEIVRKDLGLTTLEDQRRKGFAVYCKSIDHGQGVQTVYVNDGKVVNQSIGPADGLHFSYTGDGNPEWVGQSVTVIYGKGFKRVRGAQVQDIELEWLESEAEEY
jgi:hypothetical protein